MSDKFSFKWNDYQSNWSRSLTQLRKEKDFADVTLVTDEKVKFSAHKVLSPPQIAEEVCCFVFICFCLVSALTAANQLQLIKQALRKPWELLRPEGSQKLS